MGGKEAVINTEDTAGGEGRNRFTYLCSKPNLDIPIFSGSNNSYILDYKKIFLTKSRTDSQVL